MSRKIVIKSFNGIGDLLFVTPTLRRVKEAYPDSCVAVNTNRPTLLENNPFVDKIGTKNEGIFLAYPAPDCKTPPNQHHILSDWQIVCEAYDLKTKIPELQPELYTKRLPSKRDVIGVQVLHKRLYHGKRVWPHFEELAEQEGFEPIPFINTNDPMQDLVRKVSEYKLVVCSEGGISHIAAALGTHAVVLFGGFSNPIWTGYPSHKNLVSDIDSNKANCRCCFNMKPCEHDFECWNQFSLNHIKELALKC